MSPFSTISEVEQLLEGYVPARLHRHAYTTEYVSAFLKHIDNPQNRIPAIHIAGTSGKTSTAYYTAALLKSAGQRVGLLTSPHIASITERVQINLEPLPDTVFCGDFSVFFDLVEQSGVALSYAELLYSFAFWEFARMGLDCMVVEVGMGGLLDATNTITSERKICIITDIGLDHTKALGGTLAAIAQHKAGIIGTHNAVFCYPQSDEIMSVITSACQQKQADLRIVHTVPKMFQMDFLPLFQQRNFGLAAVATEYFLERSGGGGLLVKTVRNAAQTVIPGRMEIYEQDDVTIILDGAHNTQKLQALTRTLQARFQNVHAPAIVGFISSSSRDLANMLRQLLPVTSCLIIPDMPPSSTHAWHTAKTIAKAARAVGFKTVIVADDIAHAMQVARANTDTYVLVTGSLYLLQYVKMTA